MGEFIIFALITLTLLGTCSVEVTDESIKINSSTDNESIVIDKETFTNKEQPKLRNIKK